MNTHVSIWHTCTHTRFADARTASRPHTPLSKICLFATRTPLYALYMLSPFDIFASLPKARSDAHTRSPLLKASLCYKNIHASLLLAYAHSLCRCLHHFTPTPACVENTPLCYEHTAMLSAFDPFASSLKSFCRCPHTPIPR